MNRDYPYGSHRRPSLLPRRARRPWGPTEREQDEREARRFDCAECQDQGCPDRHCISCPCLRCTLDDFDEEVRGYAF